MDSAANMQLEWYQKMCLIRAFEREIYTLNKAGLIPGTAHQYVGMEAIAVGACAATDKIVVVDEHPSRPRPLSGARLDPGRMMAEILGRDGGYCRGKGGSMHITDVSRGMLGADGIVGGGISIAVGAALALRLRGRRAVVFCFFGDGAANQGSFPRSSELCGSPALGGGVHLRKQFMGAQCAFTENWSGGSWPIARRRMGCRESKSMGMRWRRFFTPCAKPRSERPEGKAHRSSSA